MVGLDTAAPQNMHACIMPMARHKESLLRRLYTISGLRKAFFRDVSMKLWFISELKCRRSMLLSSNDECNIGIIQQWPGAFEV